MTRTFVPEDLYRIRQVTDVAAHPDGCRIAYVVSWCDEGSDANRSEIWLAPDGGPDGHRPLTRGHAASSPCFSPDGRYLAFLARQPRRPAQLQILPLDGGEALTLGPFDDGCDSPVWLPDSSGLLVVAPRRPPEQRGRSAEELAERPGPRRITSGRYRFNGRGWIHDRVRQLFLVGLVGLDGADGLDGTDGAHGAEPTALTDGSHDVAQPTVSPDGRHAVVVSAREDDQELLGGSDLWLLDLPGGTSTLPSGTSTPLRRLTDGRGSWVFARFVGDGSQLLAVGQVTRGDAGLAVPWLIPVGGGTPRRLGDGETGVHSAATGAPPVVAVLDDAVLLAGIRRGRVRVDRYPLVGSQEPAPITTVADEPPMIGAFAASPDGHRLHYAGSSPTRPAELFRVEPSGPELSGPELPGADRGPAAAGAPPAGAPSPLTALNEAFLAEVELVDYEEIEVPAADGHPVHGIVVRPGSAASGQAIEAAVEPDGHPGLLYVHGGPLAQYGWGFFDEFQAAAASGHVLVAGNPRGSEGYGQAHASAITGGGLGGRDWDDVQALADHLAALPEVDAGRLGIGGGSYGGFMTTWAIGHTDRFAAALSERAVNNWETLEATSDIGAYFTGIYTGATNLTDVAEQRRQSPITYAARISTPTLILHAEEDWRCPTEQAEQLFAALRRRGVPVEMVRFPGENHELTRSGRPSLRVERLHIVHEWWSRWLGSTAFPRP